MKEVESRRRRKGSMGGRRKRRIYEEDVYGVEHVDEITRKKKEKESKSVKGK